MTKPWYQIDRDCRQKFPDLAPGERACAPELRVPWPAAQRGCDRTKAAALPLLQQNTVAMQAIAVAEQQAPTTARERLRHSLKDFLKLTLELFESISRVTTGAEPRRSPPEVVAELLANDARLTAACEDLDQMRKFEVKVRLFKKQMRQEDKVVEDMLAALRSVESKLYDAIEAAKPVADAHQTAKAQPVDLTDVMYVARNVSYTTRARPGFQPGMPMKGYLRPYPLPAEMCCGTPRALHPRPRCSPQLT
eukprot:COSAG02_NODE_2600_length_8448_cov_43.599473_2_plen_250_part_00